MKAKDLREKSLEDLKELEKSTMKEVFQTKFKNFTNRLDDTSMIKKTRRELARIRTLLVERTRGAVGSEAAAVKAPVAPKAAKSKTPKPAKAAAAPKAQAKSAESKPAAKKTSKKSESK
jgi:large subunit ribosomal protein L29